MNHSSTNGWPQVVALSLGLPAVLALLLVAFAWPPSQIEPRDVPIAVAAPGGAVGGLPQPLSDALEGDAFEVTPMESRDAAVAAIEGREVYGAIVVTPQGPEMLVSSAASPVVAQLLTQVASEMAAAAGRPPSVTDVVPLPEADPRGAVFAAGALPLVIGGIAVGAVLALRVAGRARRLLTGLVVAAASGLALAALQQFWFDALGGSYWANAGIYALAVAAVAAAVAGLHHVLGLPGLGVAAATMLLLGNPLSAVTSAPELLPAGWSELGQLLPPGAAGTALRSTAFFDGAGVATPLLVLSAWLLVGAALAAWPVHRAATHAAARRTPPGPAVDAPQAV